MHTEHKLLDSIKESLSESNNWIARKEWPYFRDVLTPEIRNQAHLGYLIKDTRLVLSELKNYMKKKNIPRIQNLIYLLYDNGFKVLKHFDEDTMVIYWDDNIYHYDLQSKEFKIWNYFDEVWTKTLSKINLEIRYDDEKGSLFRVIYVDLYDTFGEIKEKIKTFDDTITEVRDFHDNRGNLYGQNESDTLLDEKIDQKNYLFVTIVCPNRGSKC